MIPHLLLTETEKGGIRGKRTRDPRGLLVAVPEMESRALDGSQVSGKWRCAMVKSADEQNQVMSYF